MAQAVVSPINNTVTEHVLNPQKDPITLHRKITVMEKVDTACVTAAAGSHKS